MEDLIIVLGKIPYRLSHKIIAGQGTSFGLIFKTLGALHHVEIQSTGTEAH